jgi:hypothetical protein
MWSAFENTEQGNVKETVEKLLEMNMLNSFLPDLLSTGRIRLLIFSFRKLVDFMDITGLILFSAAELVVPKRTSR